MCANSSNLVPACLSLSVSHVVIFSWHQTNLNLLMIKLLEAEVQLSQYQGCWIMSPKRESQKQLFPVEVYNSLQGQNTRGEFISCLAFFFFFFSSNAAGVA